MNKQNFLISCIENKEVVNTPYIRTYKMLKKSMANIYIELRRMRSAEEMDERIIEILQILTYAFCDLSEEELRPKEDGIVQIDTSIFEMMRG